MSGRATDIRQRNSTPKQLRPARWLLSPVQRSEGSHSLAASSQLRLGQKDLSPCDTRSCAPETHGLGRPSRGGFYPAIALFSNVLQQFGSWIGSSHWLHIQAIPCLYCTQRMGSPLSNFTGGQSPIRKQESTTVAGRLPTGKEIRESKNR
jgi:hypothetical protein